MLYHAPICSFFHLCFVSRFPDHLFLNRVLDPAQHVFNGQKVFVVLAQPGHEAQHVLFLHFPMQHRRQRPVEQYRPVSGQWKPEASLCTRIKFKIGKFLHALATCLFRQFGMLFVQFPQNIRHPVAPHVQVHPRKTFIK